LYCAQSPGGGTLAQGGGVAAVDDLAVPAVLAMALAASGDEARARELLDAVERRLAAGEPLEGEARWYVPEARRRIAEDRR